MWSGIARTRPNDTAGRTMISSNNSALYLEQISSRCISKLLFQFDIASAAPKKPATSLASTSFLLSPPPSSEWRRPRGASRSSSLGDGPPLVDGLGIPLSVTRECAGIALLSLSPFSFRVQLIGQIKWNIY